MSMLNHGKGAMPLYLQIKEILKQQIEAERYAYGSLLPSEQELENTYQVSRITVRQAIAELENDGYVKRERGKGTTIIYNDKIDESLGVIRSFTKEMEDRGMKAGTAYAKIEKIPASLHVATHLEVAENEEIFHLYRIRTGNDEPIVVFETYLNGQYDFPLEDDKYYGAMYELFEQIGVHKPVLVKEKFEAMLADKLLAEGLKVPVGSAIFKRERVSYNANNEVIEYTISYYRGDRYSYSITLNQS